MSQPEKLIGSLGIVQQEKPIALCCADLHLSSKAPVARSAEPDWLAAQARQLDQLRRLAVSPTGEQRLPCLVAGDIFDRWNASPEVVNMALSHLPHLHAIYGNHDLPNHSVKELRRSAFWTLVKAGKVTMIESGKPVELSGGKQPLRVHGFPYGCPIHPLEDSHDLYLEVALIHAYVWSEKKGTGYKGASTEQTTGAYRKQLRGYDVAIFGDNHIPFEVYKTIKPDDDAPESLDPKYWSRQLLYNCGGFFRRKIDEQEHRPSVGLLYADGRIVRHYLSCGEDKFMDTDDVKGLANGIGFQGFIEALTELGDQALDFTATVRRTLDREKVPDSVKQIILAALEAK